jgi:hypothetical protein
MKRKVVPPPANNGVPPPANIKRSESLVSKTRATSEATAESAKVTKAAREAAQALNREVGEQMERNRLDQKQPATSLSDKIMERLQIAQTLKDKPIDDPEVERIKVEFGIDPSERDKRNIIDKILDGVEVLREWLGADNVDNSDPTHICTYLDYIALLVTKSMIDAQMNPSNSKYNHSILREDAKRIAERLIANYTMMKNPKGLPIEKIAEHIIEQAYYTTLLEAESNQPQASRLQKDNESNTAIKQKAMSEIDTILIQLHELNKKLTGIKKRQLHATFNRDRTRFNPFIYDTEIAIAKNYISQIRILKEAIKDINANTPISNSLLEILEEKLLNIQLITVNDEWETKKKDYKNIAKTELELYKEGEVLRDKAKSYMGFNIKKPEGPSENEAKIRAENFAKNLYKGGRRTLRAAKKKRTLRAAKKRTLRASKKLRRSTPSK